ncbi:MAG: enoyl-CoA hydratase-related protein [Actinomycetota bacterium]|nr:enoyl-CoA hydratase-related protein [Actinomycetota bacterium]
MSDDVLVETRGPTVTLRLNRPAKHNAITAGMYESLADALEAVDPAATPFVLLTGSGTAFTAGNDLADMKANPPRGEQPAPVRFLDALSRTDAVVIAAVDGHAIGIGTTLLLHCDLVYASARSTFRFPFVDLGLVPEAASTLLLPQLIGHQRAAQAMLFGESFSAAEAQAAGFVNEVVPTAKDLEALVAHRMSVLGTKPRAALSAIKRLLRDDTATSVNTRLALDSKVLTELLSGAGQNEAIGLAGFRVPDGDR